VRQRNYGFERRRKADAKRAKQLAKQERKRGEGDPPGPDMGEVQDAGAPVGMWEWFSPSRSRVVTTDTGARPAADGADDWVLLTDAEAETPPAADGGEDPAHSGA
jgi:hypothetical protein